MAKAQWLELEVSFFGYYLVPLVHSCLGWDAHSFIVEARGVLGTRPLSQCAWRGWEVAPHAQCLREVDGPLQGHGAASQQRN